MVLRRRTGADAVKSAEMLAREQQQLLDQLLSNTNDIKLQRLLDVSQQLGQTSVTLPLKTNQKPATTTTRREPARSTTINTCS